MSLKSIINNEVQSAISYALGEEFAATDPIIKLSNRAEFGDYQANFAMGLAKQLKQNPRDLATKVTQYLKGSVIFSKAEVAGPGFINLYLNNEFLVQQLLLLISDSRCGVKEVASETVVVDYGGPNVAKEMHVGHLRSTVIGDAIVRVLSFLGHEVIRQNHMGDWGTQFGMLIQYLLDENWQAQTEHSIADLNALYQAAKKRYDEDADFAKRARERVVLLQSGEQQTRDIWQALVAESERHFEKVYQRLGVLLTPDDIKSESAYNDTLPAIVHELQKSGVAETSDGAQVIFLDGFADQNDKPVPMIIQKSDGGYLYATTDLAAMRYRLTKLKATRLIYVIDSRQGQHMKMLFAATKKQAWVNDQVTLEHAAFGSVLGDDRKPFKTRSGETIKLIDLLDEAKQRALTIVHSKKNELTPDEQNHIAEVMSVAAIKYADLSSDRIKDYVFDWDRMLSFDGNSAPYLLNAYVRIQAVFRKGDIDVQSLKDTIILLEHAQEKALALKVLAFADVINLVAQDLAPHYLCHYLCELAADFHAFYEHCPILNADEKLKQSRLALAVITAKVLEQGLALLGINVIDKM
jgi:arginyl-tRNA synthetase